MAVRRWLNLDKYSSSSSPEVHASSVLRSLRNHPRNASFFRSIPEEQLLRLVSLLVAKSAGKDTKELVERYQSFSRQEEKARNNRGVADERLELENGADEAEEVETEESDSEPRKRISSQTSLSSKSKQLPSPDTSPAQKRRPAMPNLDSDSEASGDNSLPVLSVEPTPRDRENRQLKSNSNSSPKRAVNPDEDLNKLDDEELERIKKEMDREFEKNRIKPDDPDFEYDKPRDFGPPKEDCEWDEDEDEDEGDDDEGADSGRKANTSTSHSKTNHSNSAELFHKVDSARSNPDSSRRDTDFTKSNPNSSRRADDDVDDFHANSSSSPHFLSAEDRHDSEFVADEVEEELDVEDIDPPLPDSPPARGAASASVAPSSSKRNGPTAGGTDFEAEIELETDAASPPQIDDDSFF